jgi:hypothetical protein
VLEIDFDESYSIGSLALFTWLSHLEVPLKLIHPMVKSQGILMTAALAHNLDAFSVNSGSPIFNADTHKIIGVHVRGLGSNTSQTEAGCFDWTKATS